MEQQIIAELTKLLQKTGVEGLTFDISPDPNPQLMETVLINIKAINARYDKPEAYTQVRWLMENYNIQIDELMENIRH